MENNEHLEQSLEKLLMQMGAETEQALRMAPQLIKRARQIASERGISDTEALRELLEKIRQARSG